MQCLVRMQWQRRLSTQVPKLPKWRGWPEVLTVDDHWNAMRSYIMTSGALFSLVVAVHVFRLVAEGFGPLSNPIFVFSTLASAAMSAWAWFAFKAAKQPPPPRSDA